MWGRDRKYVSQLLLMMRKLHIMSPSKTIRLYELLLKELGIK